MPDELLEETLMSVGSRYFTAFGVCGPYSISRDGKFLSSKISELENFLHHLQRETTEAHLQVEALEHFLGVAHCQSPRIIALSSEDRQRIPHEFWDKYYFLFLSRSACVEEAKGELVKQRVEGILSIAKEHARLYANFNPEAMDLAFNAIFNYAITDSALDLLPLLSKVSSEEHKFLLKVYIYSVLAKMNFNPDILHERLNMLGEIAPLVYFTDGTRAEFKTNDKHGVDGIELLLYEAAIYSSENVFRTMSTNTFSQMQEAVELMQFFEDLANLTKSFSRLKGVLLSI